jgi:nucleoside-diphosphate-sugar epimerase
MATTAFVTGGSGFIGGALVRRLRADGWEVRALARSDSSARRVADAGAEPAPGDLDDAAALRAGAEGCEVAFHAAAALGEWGRREDFERGNVTGTRNALAACREAGVRRFVHVGTEAALLAGQPLVNVDETAPLRPDSKALYSRTKARAEQVARAGGAVVIRPRLVWGPGDTTILPALSDAVRRNRFAWIGGGTHRTSTTHVNNVIEGLMLGAQKGEPGEAYFVTDGEPQVFREFVTRLLATQDIQAPDKSVPRPIPGALATIGEAAWRVLPLPGQPPVTRLAYWLASQECTIDISRARRDLGYSPVTSVDQGMEELRST